MKTALKNKTESVFEAVSVCISIALGISILTVIAFFGRQLNRAYNPALIHQEKIATFNISQVEQIQFLKQISSE